MQEPIIPSGTEPMVVWDTRGELWQGTHESMVPTALARGSVETTKICELCSWLSWLGGKYAYTQDLFPSLMAVCNVPSYRDLGFRTMVSE